MKVGPNCSRSFASSLGRDSSGLLDSGSLGRSPRPEFLSSSERPYLTRRRAACLSLPIWRGLNEITCGFNQASGAEEPFREARSESRPRLFPVNDKRLRSHQGRFLSPDQPDDERDDKGDQKDKEQDLGDARGSCRDAPATKNCRHNRDNEKCGCPTQHLQSPDKGLKVRETAVIQR